MKAARDAAADKPTDNDEMGANPHLAPPEPNPFPIGTTGPGGVDNTQTPDLEPTEDSSECRRNQDDEVTVSSFQ
jgi:hypothetical protein